MTIHSRIKYGILAGTGVMAWFLLFYLINKRLIFHPGVIWSSYLIYLISMVLACRKERGAAPDAYPFRQPLKTGFAVFALANALYYLFFFLMTNVFDPELNDIQRMLILESREQMESLMGKENADQMIRQMEEKGFRMTLSEVLLSFSRSLIGGFVLSLAVAAFMKRER